MALPRFSSAMLLHFLLGLLLLAVAPTTTTAQPLYQFCRATDTNYTVNSTFQYNLNRLLPSLADNGSATGFFNGTAGDASDRVYGLVLCRGDVATGPCRTCLATATQGIVQNCPLKKSSVVWYDNCMLRYSNVQFFSVPDDALKVYLRNPESVSEVIQFNRQRTRLMAALVRYAAYNNSARLFAIGEAEYVDPTPKIYGLVQCTRDQSADDCNACLEGIVGEIPSMFSQWRGARILKATCNFRYELYPFFNGSPMLSVPLAANATPPTAAPPPPGATLNPPTASAKKKSSTGTVLAIAIPVGAALILIPIMYLCFYRRRVEKKKIIYKAVSQDIVTIESLLFDLPTLRTATANFSDLNKLGQGGFGSVYKGLLPDGKEIAVKRLLAGSGQGVEELKNEVVLLAKLQHRNLVRLLGVCLEGEEKLLVYEYVPNRSLDTFLFDPTEERQLNWETRYKIIGGIARGLQYLHEDSQVKIIHRDLKASNVLLDEDMNSKISDFGLARLIDVDQTQASTTRVVGTYGYMAPEYAMRGHFSNKSDVFSFGVLVLEIVTGQRNSGSSESGTPADILKSVWEHWTNGTVEEIVDPSLGGRFQRSELMRCIQIGLLCVQEAPTERPTMSTVVLALSTYSMSLQVPSRPALFVAFSQPDAEALKGALKYSSTGATHHESRAKSLLCSPTPNELSITELEPR